MSDREIVGSQETPAVARALGTLALVAITAAFIKWFVTHEKKELSVKENGSNSQRQSDIIIENYKCETEIPNVQNGIPGVVPPQQDVTDETEESGSCKCIEDVGLLKVQLVVDGCQMQGSSLNTTDISRINYNKVLETSRIIKAFADNNPPKAPRLTDIALKGEIQVSSISSSTVFSPVDSTNVSVTVLSAFSDGTATNNTSDQKMPFDDCYLQGQSEHVSSVTVNCSEEPDSSCETGKHHIRDKQSSEMSVKSLGSQEKMLPGNLLSEGFMQQSRVKMGWQAGNIAWRVGTLKVPLCDLFMQRNKRPTEGQSNVLSSISNTNHEDNIRTLVCEVEGTANYCLTPSAVDKVIYKDQSTYSHFIGLSEDSKETTKCLKVMTECREQNRAEEVFNCSKETGELQFCDLLTADEGPQGLVYDVCLEAKNKDSAQKYLHVAIKSHYRNSFKDISLYNNVAGNSKHRILPPQSYLAKMTETETNDTSKKQALDSGLAVKASSDNMGSDMCKSSPAQVFCADLPWCDRKLNKDVPHNVLELQIDEYTCKENYSLHQPAVTKRILSLPGPQTLFLKSNFTGHPQIRSELKSETCERESVTFLTKLPMYGGLTEDKFPLIGRRVQNQCCPDDPCTAHTDYKGKNNRQIIYNSEHNITINGTDHKKYVASSVGDSDQQSKGCSSATSVPSLFSNETVLHPCKWNNKGAGNDSAEIHIEGQLVETEPYVITDCKNKSSSMAMHCPNTSEATFSRMLIKKKRNGTNTNNTKENQSSAGKCWAVRQTLQDEAGEKDLGTYNIQQLNKSLACHTKQHSPDSNEPKTNGRASIATVPPSLDNIRDCDFIHNTDRILAKEQVPSAHRSGTDSCKVSDGTIWTGSEIAEGNQLSLKERLSEMSHDIKHTIVKPTQPDKESLSSATVLETSAKVSDNMVCPKKKVMSHIAENALQLNLASVTETKMPLITKSCDNIHSGESSNKGTQLANRAQSMLCLLTKHYSSTSPCLESAPIEAVSKGSFVCVPTDLQHVGKVIRFHLTLGYCPELLKLAKKNRATELLKAVYMVISDNYLHALKNSAIYSQLSGSEREHVLQLRTRGTFSLCVAEMRSIFKLNKTKQGLSEIDYSVPKTQLYALDMEKNHWRVVTNIPEEAYLKGCSICSLHNYLFIAGGIQKTGNPSACSNKLFCYNPLTDIWSQLAPMNQARSQLKLVPLDGNIYAIGGECLNTVEKYDPRLNKWTFAAPLPKGSFAVAHEATACAGDIYISGGHLFYRLLKYSPVHNEWEECPFNASKGRSCDMVALGNNIYRFDIERDSVSIYTYNTTARLWSESACVLPGSKIPFRCAVLDGAIYCLNRDTTTRFVTEDGKADFVSDGFCSFPSRGLGYPCPVVLSLPGSVAQTSV